MQSKFKTFDICQIAFGAVVISICAWIMIPTAVPFTLQTFGIFTVLKLLGGKKGFFSVLLYLIMGTVGLPVFSGFTGGPGVLVSVTGGYLIGFLLMAAIYWFLLSNFNCKDNIALAIGLVICYVFGSLWLAVIYGGVNMFAKALYVGVLPFIVPDVIKMIFAHTVAKMFRKHMRF